MSDQKKSKRRDFLFTASYALGTVAGATVDALGCVVVQADSDGDGVPNSLDDCPNTPVGTQVGDWGCIDTDGDGVDDLLALNYYVPKTNEA